MSTQILGSDRPRRAGGHGRFPGINSSQDTLPTTLVSLAKPLFSSKPVWEIMNQGSRYQGKCEAQRKRLWDKDREKVKLLRPEIGLELTSMRGGEVGETLGAEAMGAIPVLFAGPLPGTGNGDVS